MPTPTARRAPAATRDPRWRAIIERDRTADGAFYYSVKTTGVYCRPTCAARLPNPRNVQFHRTREDAERAGFRPCKRCQPDRPSIDARYAVKIAAICRLIESSESPIPLARLATRAGLSPHHFHRVFKQITGVTPRAYAIAHRSRHIRDTLRKAMTVTEAIYESGFSSGGRFYENVPRILGMTPTAYRAGGSNATIRVAVADCSLGSILVAQSDRGVCAILLGEDPGALIRELQDQFPKATLVGNDEQFDECVAAVVAFVERPARGLDLPLDVRGTAFQQRVWQALREIPPGSTMTYGAIASRLGQPMSSRAVARACAANTLAVAIPCHRVVRADGEPSGYRWGIERKRALLHREGAD